jgi:hypothetical protein
VWVNRLKAIGATDKGPFTPIILGHSVSCNQDGTVIAAMAANYSPFSGLTASEAVKLWRWNGTVYVEDTGLTAPGKLNVDWSDGGSLALTEDGSVVIVAERGGDKLHRIDYDGSTSTWGTPTVIPYATAFPDMDATPRGDIGRLPTVVSKKVGYVLVLVGNASDSEASSNAAVVFKFPDTYTSGDLVNVEIPMSDGYWCDMSKTSDYVVIGRGEFNSQRGQVAVYKLIVDVTSITFSIVNTVSGINNTNADGGGDKIGAGVAISNDGKYFAFQCNNALSKLAGVYPVDSVIIDKYAHAQAELSTAYTSVTNQPLVIENALAVPTYFTQIAEHKGYISLVDPELLAIDALVSLYSTGIATGWDVSYENSILSSSHTVVTDTRFIYNGSEAISVTSNQNLMSIKKYNKPYTLDFTMNVTAIDKSSAALCFLNDNGTDVTVQYLDITHDGTNYAVAMKPSTEPLTLSTTVPVGEHAVKVVSSAGFPQFGTPPSLKVTIAGQTITLTAIGSQHIGFIANNNVKISQLQMNLK